MKISEVMTKSPTTSDVNTDITEIARHMLTCDCGAIPVVDGERVVGMVTDRDLVLRAIATGKPIDGMTAREVMSHPVAVISSDEDLAKAIKVLEENQVRRLPVVDGQNRLVGIVSQADLARAVTASQVGEIVQSISQTMPLGHE